MTLSDHQIRLLRVILVATILYITVFSQNQIFTARSQPPLSVNFTWTPKSAVIGNSLNFTATATGGTAPYTYSWNFGDGTPAGTGVWLFHSYNKPGTYMVNVTVTDSLGAKKAYPLPVTIFDWPVRAYNWLINWNNTGKMANGFNVWNVTYKGVLLIRDARLAYVVNYYKNNYCGPFEDRPYLSDTLGVLNDGNLSYGNFSTAPDPYFQILAEWRVGGYSYHEAFRFYASGRWEPEIQIGRGGCLADHIYNPMWRINIAMSGSSSSFVSQYTPSGTWRDLIWEGVYTDNGFRDSTLPSPLNTTQWRVGENGMYYYLAPKIFRVDTDLPYIAPSIALVRAHPNELQTWYALECGTPQTIPYCDSPSQYVNGELAFRRDIVIWFMPQIWDHGPIDTTSPAKRATLTFYPGGTWP